MKPQSQVSVPVAATPNAVAVALANSHAQLLAVRTNDTTN
jgi:hypothetical protein